MLLEVMILIILYISITVLTDTIKEKPFGAQFATDHLCTDVATSIFAATASTSFMIIAREINGPFNEPLSKFCGVVQQFCSSAFSVNILSLQLAQFSNFFLASRWATSFKCPTPALIALSIKSPILRCLGSLSNAAVGCSYLANILYPKQLARQ